MKKLFLSLLGIIFAFSFILNIGFTNLKANAVTLDDGDQTLKLSARSAILIDKESGSVLYENNADARLPVASMTKTMTLLLTFEAIQRGEANMDDIVNISSYSASQEGSECFLDAGKDYKLYDLIKAVVIASANDACVAIAEHLAGTDELFASKMNKRANELKLLNTNFKNSTGLHEDGHYSSARDIAQVMAKLSEFEEYVKLARIWMDKIVHTGGRETELVNTNRLIRNFKDCICGKTGYTDEAMYCLVSVAKRQNMTLVSCVIGERTKEDRFEDCVKLFNYGFSSFEAMNIIEKDKPITYIKVKGAREKSYPVFIDDDVKVVTKKGEGLNIETKINLKDNLKAPINKGCEVGELEVYKNGVEISKRRIITNEDIDKNSFKDCFIEEANNFRRM